MTGQERALYRAIEAMPTLHSGHTGNLKIDASARRLWIERAWDEAPAGTWDADIWGSNGPVTGEVLEAGRWEQVDPEVWLEWIAS